MTTESPSLVSMRFMLLDIRRLGNASLSKVYPEGSVTSIMAMLLSSPSKSLKPYTEQYVITNIYSTSIEYTSNSNNNNNYTKSYVPRTNRQL